MKIFPKFLQKTPGRVRAPATPPIRSRRERKARRSTASNEKRPPQRGATKKVLGFCDELKYSPLPRPWMNALDRSIPRTANYGGRVGGQPLIEAPYHTPCRPIEAPIQPPSFGLPYGPECSPPLDPGMWATIVGGVCLVRPHIGLPCGNSTFPARPHITQTLPLNRTLFGTLRYNPRYW